MCLNLRDGGLQLIIWTSRIERQGECSLEPRDCHFIFLACVSKPKYETDWRQKKCLGDSSLWGWGNLVRFFFWGRQALYKHLFLHPSPTYFFLHPPSLSISLSSSHPLPPFIHSFYSMPPKASTKKSQAKEVALVAPKYVIFLWIFHCSHNARRVTRQTTAIRNQKAKRGKPASGKGGAPTRGRKQPKRCVLYFILYLPFLISLLALKLFLTQRLRRTMKKRKMKSRILKKRALVIL